MVAKPALTVLAVARPQPLVGQDLDEAAGGLANRPGPIENGEARLAYLAVTRTRRRLDMGGLSWIDDHPEGRPAR
ncbi:hypothetical protein AB0D71_41960 [Streptomyces avermitilis]|uniref:hypothetical protein n=1 Tax=Streptomyces avermitilis TaxID=33903 RepID=UPI0033E3DDDF